VGDAGSAEAATALALRYQLVTEHTNLLLIAEREDGERIVKRVDESVQ
jgi:hypothetical protein